MLASFSESPKRRVLQGSHRHVLEFLDGRTHWQYVGGNDYISIMDQKNGYVGPNFKKNVLEF